MVEILLLKIDLTLPGWFCRVYMYAEQNVFILDICCKILDYFHTEDELKNRTRPTMALF